MNKPVIIGLGEVGTATFIELNKKIKCYGVDLNDKRLEELTKQGYEVSNEIIKSNIYIICVYTTKQVMEVLNKIDKSNNPLIVIESTIIPGTVEKIKKHMKIDNQKFSLAVFPHRYNPNDKAHYVFNLDRIIGCIDKETEKKVLNFYAKFMNRNLIHVCPIELAEIVKPLENAYRFIEISIAEEIKILCDRYNLDFEKLRKVMNTKWNIDLKKARDGIGGRCLPKDIKLIANYFKENIIFNVSINLDKIYKQYLQKTK